MDEAELEDHLASFLADIAGTLASVDVAAGAPTDAIRDATAIQRLVAERHGTQRARLGWKEAEIEREFAILREELAAALRRWAPGHLRGPTPTADEGEAERALELLDRLLRVAERTSVHSYRQAVAERGAARGDEAHA